jgi:hypothetical protein
MIAARRQLKRPYRMLTPFERLFAASQPWFVIKSSDGCGGKVPDIGTS